MVFSVKLDNIEKSMFSFANETENLWNQYIEETLISFFMRDRMIEERKTLVP